ncbi:TIM21 protein [Onchocerca flexuosa]|uniref:Mitochondrial import inner membrane translocase subunit Tim21 n=1 Tax=Onchocerca flexuosa TaxID=387005 RepID=A0A238BUV5_9BILA|nr:TIM21 protein [Onchocerca flexuosa]
MSFTPFTIGTMLPHIGLTAIERVIQRRCSLFLRHRFIPIATVTRRNVESVSNKEIKMNQNKSILEKVVMKESQTTVEKVKEKATNAYLYMAYVVSMIVMGGMAYLLYEEMLSPGAPQTVFSKALSLIKKDPECHKLLGDSIMGYVEGRGRMKQDGKDRTRVMFNVKGTRREGIATCEMEKNNGTWEWRFLIVSSADLIPEYVVLIDNR